MTEAEWLVCEQPMAMFNHLETHADLRRGWTKKLIGWVRERFRRRDSWSSRVVERRLYMLACGVNRAWWTAMNPGAALPRRCEVEEQFSDAGGEIPLEELLADDPERRWWWPNPWHLVSNVFRRGSWTPEYESVRAAYCGLVRCIFGNPFRSVIFDPAWLTSTVTTLAQQMYDSRDFGAMPILADALQDAGCTNDDILTHSRNPGPHTRGCWVVDLVLGKN